MLLQWLVSGLLVLFSGLGVLHSAVNLQSYFLLAAGVVLAAGGTMLMVRNENGAAAA